MNILLICFNYYSMEIILLFLISVLMIIYLFNSIFKLQYVDVIIICIFVFCQLFLILWFLPTEKEGIQLFLGNYLLYSEFFVFIKLLIVFIMLFYFIMVLNYCNIQDILLFEYIIIVLVALFSVLMIINGNNLFLIFIFLELLNLCVYCLLGFNKDSNKGIESAFKYFVQSSFATIIGFFGVSLIYMSAGTLFLHELNVLVINNDLNLISIFGIILIISSVFFKLGIFPLHSWLPEVYQGSILITLAFIALIPKIAYIVLFLKLYFKLINCIKIFCLLVSSISVVYGCFVTLYQTSFRRLLAYGSMVHIGLIIFSLSVFSLDGIISSHFYLLFYINLMLFVFFFMFFLFEYNNNGEIIFIDDISQISLKISDNFIVSVFFIFILFSLAGLPFFVGFVVKWYVFLNLLNLNNVGIVFIFLCLSIFSASYYIRIIRFFIFFQAKDVKLKTFNRIKYDSLFYHCINFLFLLNIFIFIFHSIIYLIILKIIIIWWN
jgi:NADH-quinone oxidoreductase subunit N